LFKTKLKCYPQPCSQPTTKPTLTIFKEVTYMKKTKSRLAFSALVLASLFSLSSYAFPTKPLRLIVPFPAGGAADGMARGMALRLGTELGQQVIIDNRGGAAGTVAAEAAARMPADGYTLFFGSMSTQAIAPSMYKKLRYDPVADFAPISLTHIAPRVLVVGANVPAKSVAELIALARGKPGLLSYGSAGNGSAMHLSGALFESLAKVDMLHIPYKGSAPLVTDLLSGRVDMSFDSYTVYEEHIKSGKVRAIAVTSKSRLTALPNVPTIAESGLAGYEMANWLGVLAPAGTPQDVLTIVHTALGKVMADPSLRTQLNGLGIEPTFGSRAAFGELIRREIPHWAEIVKKSGATVE
jgi:tripartite-type tricarboxylate transporter receptor subunit TctC